MYNFVLLTGIIYSLLSMNFQNILLEKRDAIALVIINRPEKLNALNSATIGELNEVLTMLENEPEIRCIIITGSGQKAFVAGADISEFAHFNAVQGAELARKGQELLFDYVANMRTPVIAAINGFALGGGLELAMAAHIRIASENAKLGLPEVSLGVIPGYGGTQRLPELVGKGVAFEMIMTAGMINAERAVQTGLVNKVTSIEELMPLAYAMAEKIIANSPQAISSAIKAVNEGYRAKQSGYEAEIALFGKSFETSEFKEGTSAFLQKRKPNF